MLIPMPARRRVSGRGWEGGGCSVAHHRLLTARSLSPSPPSPSHPMRSHLPSSSLSSLHLAGSTCETL
eukprot:2988255-Rhodomonas_salina.1